MQDFHPLGAALAHSFGEGSIKKFFDAARDSIESRSQRYVCWSLTAALDNMSGRTTSSSEYAHLSNLVCALRDEVQASLVSGEGYFRVTHNTYSAWCTAKTGLGNRSDQVIAGRLAWLDRLEHYVAHGGEFPQPQLPE